MPPRRGGGGERTANRLQTLRPDVRFGPILLQKSKSNLARNLAKAGLWTSLRLRSFSKPRGGSVLGFRLNDVVPHIAAGKTHQRL